MANYDLLGPASSPGAVTVRPPDERTVGATDTFFRDCSSPELDDGTEFHASWFNAILAVLRSAIRGNGQTAGSADIVAQDNADDALLLKAMQYLIQRGQPQYGEDTGTINNVVAALSPALKEYKAGAAIRVKMAFSPTGATVINCNGLGNVAIVKGGGAALAGMEWEPGDIVDLICTGTAFQTNRNARPILTANRTIYVNGTIGNDANDGVSNTSGHALATVQAAIDLAFRYAPSQFTITIQIADGTYASAATPGYAGPNLAFNGNAGAPANVVLGSTNHGLVISGPITATVSNLKLQAPSAGFVGLVVGSGASCSTQNTVSGICETAVFQATAGFMNIGSHTFAGTSKIAFWAFTAGQIVLKQSATFTISANMSVVNGFANSQVVGAITVNAPTPTFPGGGVVTGPKYSASLNGIINTQGAGVNYFPGSAVGATGTGGQYQ